MKIAFANTSLVTCGGIITNFEYAKELLKRGYDARLVAESGNQELEQYYGIPVYPIEWLETFTEKDWIIANRWEQCAELTKYIGRKFQFVQGNDRKYYEDLHHTALPELLKARRDESWELIGVSEYVLKDWGRGIVIPNGISERFFVDLGLERDIDALIEGNAEPNKNIPYAIEKARKDGHKKIVWMGRETYHIEGIERITNPKQEDIPAIYQRSKHFYKFSFSEGFSLPLWEATISGCEVHTWDMGCNKDWVYTKENAKEYTWKKATDKLLSL